MKNNLATDSFQGLCLIQEDGAGIKYMPIFDGFTPQERELIRDSSINLCLACISDQMIGFRCLGTEARLNRLKRIIALMEGTAR